MTVKSEILDSLSFCRDSTTSLSSLAREGRYAFIATTLAPNPTFASIARRDTVIQIREEEDNATKSIAEADPRAANSRRAFFRCVAIISYQ